MNPEQPGAAVSPQTPAPPGTAARSGYDVATLFIRIQRLKYDCWGAYISGDREDALALAEKLSATAQALRDAMIAELR